MLLRGISFLPSLSDFFPPSGVEVKKKERVEAKQNCFAPKKRQFKLLCYSNLGREVKKSNDIITFRFLLMEDFVKIKEKKKEEEKKLWKTKANSNHVLE